jgi:Uma2 family endonuclease
MATVPTEKKRSRPTNGIPLLQNGDRLSQAEFHRRYEAMPPEFRAELVGGIVYVTSPLRWEPHGTYTYKLSYILNLYEENTPGVEGAENATIVLGAESEPQPDLALRVLPEYGGQSRLDEEGYLHGAPELIIEVAHSTVALDMHRKMEDYQQAGVIEYVVMCVTEEEFHWFRLRGGQRLKPDAQGIYRSRVFPGLWIDGPALQARDGKRLHEVLKQGLASPEHARFVQRLEAKRRKHP